MREKNPVTHEEKLAYLRELREEAVHSGSEEAVEKQHAKGKLHRPRADREAARPRLLRGARHLRPPPHPRVRHGQEAPLRRRGGDRLRDDRRPHRLRLLPGLHGLRRLAGRGDGREDGQGHGPGRQGRRPGHRDQRLRWRADPGGRRLAGRLRRRLRPQRPVLRRDPADQPDHGPVRRRRGLLPRHDRLHLHGQGDLAHVHHRPRGDQDGHRRGGRVRGARRRDDPQHEVRRRPLRRRRRGAVPRGRPLPDVLPAAEQPRAAAARRAHRRPGPRGPRARHDRPRRPAEALRHAERGRRGSSTTASSSRSTSTSRRTSSAASHASTATRSASSATSRIPRRRARHRGLGEGRALRPLLRRLQRPAAHLHRRPRLPARHLAGVGRDHPPRRQAALRVHRGDRARSSPSSPARPTAAPTTS